MAKCKQRLALSGANCEDQYPSFNSSSCMEVFQNRDLEATFREKNKTDRSITVSDKDDNNSICGG